MIFHERMNMNALAVFLLFPNVKASKNDTGVVDIGVCYRLYRAEDERYVISCKTGYFAREQAFAHKATTSDDPLRCQALPYGSEDHIYSECHETTLSLPVDLSKKDDTITDIQTVLRIVDPKLLTFLGEPEDGVVEFKGKFDLVEQRVCTTYNLCPDPMGEMVFPITKCEHLAMYPGSCNGPMLPIDVDESFITDDYIQEHNEYLNENGCGLANPADSSASANLRETTIVVVSKCTKFGYKGVGTCGFNDKGGFEPRFTVTLRGHLMERIPVQAFGSYLLQRKEDDQMCLATSYSSDDTVQGTGTPRYISTCLPLGGTDIFKKYQLTKAFSSTASGDYEVFNKIEVFDGNKAVVGGPSGGNGGKNDQESTIGTFKQCDIQSNSILVVSLLLFFVCCLISVKSSSADLNQTWHLAVVAISCECREKFD